MQIVFSRTFGSAAEGGGVGVHMLVPLADMLNHGGDVAAGRLCDASVPVDNVRRAPWRRTRHVSAAVHECLPPGLLLTLGQIVGGCLCHRLLAQRTGPWQSQLPAPSNPETNC